jgi:type IV pilus assembly protein PilB
MDKKLLGQILKEKGFVTEQFLNFALFEQRATGEKLGEVLTRIGTVSDLEIAIALSEQSGYPFIDLNLIQPDFRSLELIPYNFAINNLVCPFDLEENKIKVAISDPFSRFLPDLMSVIYRMARREAEFYITGTRTLKRAISLFYFFQENPIEEKILALIDRLRVDPQSRFDVEELFNDLLILGILKRATDLHLIPTQKSLQVFYRIDGVLEPAFVLPSIITKRLINVIKIKAHLDISETRSPQDGRISFSFLDENYDLRIATAPAIFGETVVIRYLPTGAQVPSLEYLGFEPEEIQLIDEILAKPQGMFLITGPTGSGKTTTLFSSLKKINLLEKNVLTCEDPIEYLLPLTRQTQVNEEIGYTFAKAIRSFLRLDPDVILVGEVRDEETADMAVRAALTGHLFLSTLHTNDAVSSIARLVNMNIPLSFIASTLKGVVFQRLVRKICPYCKEQYIPPASLLEYYKLPKDHIYYRGRGCLRCRGKGYLGRTVVCEILYVDEEIADKIMHGYSLFEIQALAIKKGFKPLQEDAKDKVLKGITTVEEIKRVVG